MSLLNPSQALVLAEHNRWVNARLLQMAVHLAPAQLETACWLSRGSTLRTLIHQADAQWFWRLACETGEAPGRSLSETDSADVGTLRDFVAAEDDRWPTYVAGLPESRWLSMHTFSWGRARSRSRELRVLGFHALKQGARHRAEIAERLGEPGHSPGGLDFLDFASRHPGAAPTCQETQG